MSLAINSWMIRGRMKYVIWWLLRGRLPKKIATMSRGIPYRVALPRSFPFWTSPPPFVLAPLPSSSRRLVVLGSSTFTRRWNAAGSPPVLIYLGPLPVRVRAWKHRRVCVIPRCLFFLRSPAFLWYSRGYEITRSVNSHKRSCIHSVELQCRMEFYCCSRVPI